MTGVMLSFLLLLQVNLAICYISPVQIISPDGLFLSHQTVLGEGSLPIRSSAIFDFDNASQFIFNDSDDTKKISIPEGNFLFSHPLLLIS